jgi:cobalt-zinc-cadmium efflux system protein
MIQEAHTHPSPHQTPSATIRRLAWAVGITFGFVIVEAAAGVVANSLALLTDAAHNLTDVIALGLAWLAVRLATRPATAGRTYGYHRAGILVAMLNSTTLVVIALGIFYEAYQRLIAPPQVDSLILIVVAAVAFVVNTGTALLVRRGSDTDLNLRSAFVHLAADAVATLGAVAAGIIIRFTGWNVLDPLVSIVIGILIVASAWQIITQTVDILMENTPRGLPMDSLVRDVQKVEGVRGLHDVHAWSINESMRAFSAHLLTDDVTVSAGARIQSDVNRLLHERYGIAHATLQLECVGCEPDALYCEIEPHEHTSERDTEKTATQVAA